MTKTISEAAIEIAAQAAHEAGYAEAAVNAATEFWKRKNRMSNPPGKFDSAGRFYAAEQTSRVANVRAPSRAHPYSEMQAARTAEHCAEVAGVESLDVKRISRAIGAAIEAMEADSAHGRLAAFEAVGKALKVKGARKKHAA